jgi:hypothetical protein
MRWSKTESRARFNLATSGVAPFPLRELPVQLETLEINGDYGYGYPPLQKAIAAHQGVDPDCVVESAGTSMANHLAMAAIIEPGDEVLIEHPGYGPILDVARYLHANVRRFLRTRETGWVIDPGEILRAITPRTRLIVITNLHNPTSALTPDSVLREVGDIARSIGALVLVDEVYLDAVYQRTPRTSFHLGPEFVVTSSLTKVYGVSGLRCGWILARPDLAWKMRRLNDLYSATPVYPGLLLAVAVTSFGARSYVARSRINSRMSGASSTRAGRMMNSLGIFISVVCKRLTDSIQALRKHFCIHAHANTKMVRHFEKATWNC